MRSGLPEEESPDTEGNISKAVRSQVKRRGLDCWLLDKYEKLKGSYWAEEKMRAVCRQESREEVAKILDNIISA